MAEDLLPLIGIFPGGDGNPSDSDGEGEEGPAGGGDIGLMEEDDDPEVMEELDEEDDTDEDDPAPFWRARTDLDVSQPDTDPITFDPSLPGAHSYLGTDLEEVRGRTVHEDDTCLTLPILTLPGVVLTPGQTLPLHLFQSTTVAMIRRLLEGDKTFGLITSSFRRTHVGQRVTQQELTLSTIGTTAEIFSIKEETDDRAGITTVRVKATGRQRFEVKESRRTSDGTVMARVRILPERVLPEQLEGARPTSHNRFCVVPQVPLPVLPPKRSRRFSRTKRPSVALVPKPKKQGINRFSCSWCTAWPPWVYRQYYVGELVAKVKQELTSWNETLKAENMPKDPVEFSFWVAGNLPLDDGLKLFLLGIDCAEQRLRCELGIMQKCTVLCCKDCGRLIAHKQDVFSMALEGPLGAYVNPGGHVHETLTLHKAQGLSLIGRPSTEHSWFPGYAWTIVQCTSCASHMGWKFTAAKHSLHPQKFWGLCRSSLLPGLPDEERDSEEAAWVPAM